MGLVSTRSTQSSSSTNHRRANGNKQSRANNRGSSRRRGHHRSHLQAQSRKRNLAPSGIQHVRRRRLNQFRPRIRHLPHSLRGRHIAQNRQLTQKRVLTLTLGHRRSGITTFHSRTERRTATSRKQAKQGRRLNGTHLTIRRRIQGPTLLHTLTRQRIRHNNGNNYVINQTTGRRGVIFTGSILPIRLALQILSHSGHRTTMITGLRQ